MRPLYLIGWGYIAIAALLIARAPYRAFDEPAVPLVPSGALPSGPPELVWFLSVKAQCNAVEIEVMMSRSPAPTGWQGTGYGAACYALAGKIGRAQAWIDALPQGEQAAAANVVFNVGHPVADMGDDESAGPIMELVLRYLPDHYMALYHAGVAQYRTGEPMLARKNLEAFLRLYNANDGWTGNAKAVLDALRAGGGK